MFIIPAIDLKDGEAVRLYKGDYDKKTVYENHPYKIALKFENDGATFLHVVDLDGAKDGKIVNLDTIKEIRKATSMKMELGGGIRTMDTVSLYLDEVGIDRVILGTVALKNKAFVKECIDQYGPEKIVVGVDVKNGFVSTQGWLEDSDVYYIDFIHELEEIGVKYIVATDISKDGTLQGPNFDMYSEIKEKTNINFVVSGGIKDQEDVYEAARRNYYACIIGKAYYEGRIDIKEVVTCLQNESYLA